MATPPCRDVNVCGALCSVEFLGVLTNELPAWPGQPASGDTLESRSLGKQSPESVPQAKCSFDHKLRQIMRQVAPGGHRCALNSPALRRFGAPAAQAPAIQFIESPQHTKSSVNSRAGNRQRDTGAFSLPRQLGRLKHRKWRALGIAQDGKAAD